MPPRFAGCGPHDSSAPNPRENQFSLRFCTLGVKYELLERVQRTGRNADEKRSCSSAGASAAAVPRLFLAHRRLSGRCALSDDSRRECSGWTASSIHPNDVIQRPERSGGRPDRARDRDGISAAPAHTVWPQRGCGLPTCGRAGAPAVPRLFLGSRRSFFGTLRSE